MHFLIYIEYQKVSFMIRDNQIIRFLFVGSLTVAIDLLFYFLLLYINFDTYISKSISFSLGAVFAFYANKKFTFSNSKAGLFKFVIFIILYVCTLLINVISNESFLDLIGRANTSLLLAFIFATILSATINFLGMKYIVFKTFIKKND